MRSRRPSRTSSACARWKPSMGTRAAAAPTAATTVCARGDLPPPGGPATPRIVRRSPSARSRARATSASTSVTATRGSARDVVEHVGVRAGAGGLALVERVDLLHVVVPELEVEHVEVLPHARGRDRLRKHDVAALDVPAEHHLGRRPPERVGDPRDHRVVEDVALRDRRPRFGGDAVLPAVGVDLLVGEVGVQLDLIHRRFDVALGREALEVGDLEVRDADRTGPAVRPELLQRLPGGDEVAVVERRKRPVDEEEVDVVEAEVGERPVERAAGVVGLVEAVVELARHEDGGPIETGVADRLADLLLVAVHLGRVDVPVPDLEGGGHGRGGLGGVDLEDTEAELRDRVTVVEVDGGDGTHARFAPSSGSAEEYSPMPPLGWTGLSATVMVNPQAAPRAAAAWPRRARPSAPL